MTSFARTTIDEDDLAKYERLGDDWWDPNGPMGALHKFNPVRVGWIAKLMSGENAGDRPLAGKRILDVGSGGGILSESLARLGADMVGIDPATNNIAVATRHAQAEGLAIDYRATTVETLAATGERFDAVLIMEVIEHVRDVPGFVRDAGALVRPGGLMFGATLNRTLKSWALAIVGAEYVLRWLPRGTHDWHQFVTPDEFRRHMRRAGLHPFAEAGVTYNPLADRWALSTDMGCNYMLAARREA
ncbi:Ubiquinone biosynthesis O-methyltransferase [Beijerinckiaceae bacterium RH AL1]|nr:bifunctional 2-polyprenyl-6-hydroxyphenol methylase/3-demethylubiquinol 3-O-methyltransferase UbiG [Beijerinckiaceae bacterium]VVB49266.1 Ubiquinone biosynthesis O-methyltransferase [Beijerinckiaceae bacterium RH CH11]VVB49345.1 Ubiquinone biosynthesis O-methyltransferase [Beijerinckiaceae bacterium RH AL8]VVC56814.1 Ubiquinone biosynthesis O-methyltransferase [Beijerinckiaceae bacterium RH AL1]